MLRLSKQIDVVIRSSAVVMDVNLVKQVRNELMCIRRDAVRGQVSNLSCVLDPHILQANLDATIAKPKFLEAVGST